MKSNEPSILITEEINQLAELLWSYHLLNHRMIKSDCILALGSHDLRVANRAAELYLEGWAPLVIMSGGLGNVTKDEWTIPEADQFAAIAVKMGVPEKDILVENKSTNTGENIQFTAELLKSKNLNPENFIVVQKPYMERRSYATFKKHWPDKNLVVTSPQLSFKDYSTDEISAERVIHIMVGDLQRIRFYPAKGFQIEQEIPDNVWKAWERLVELGFDKHLINVER